MNIQKININLIIEDKNQPRKKFDEDKILQLAKSIEKYGLLQAIIVKKLDNHYQIIAGERRFKAVKLLKYEYIDAIIKKDENSREIALIENIQRQDLTPIEEAKAIFELKKINNYTHEELADILGKTRVYITNKLRILSADEQTKKLLSENKLSEGHTRALLGEKDLNQRQKIISQILSNNLNVRETEKLLKKRKNKSQILLQDEQEIIEMLEQKLSTKIEIKKKSQEKGSINIDYYSYEQLQDIVEKIIQYY